MPKVQVTSCHCHLRVEHIDTNPQPPVQKSVIRIRLHLIPNGTSLPPNLQSTPHKWHTSAPIPLQCIPQWLMQCLSHYRPTSRTPPSPPEHHSASPLHHFCIPHHASAYYLTYHSLCNPQSPNSVSLCLDPNPSPHPSSPSHHPPPSVFTMSVFTMSVRPTHGRRPTG